MIPAGPVPPHPGTLSNRLDPLIKVFKRNLGVILSGDKGIGKSLTAKMISIEALKQGYPTILVDEFYPGIASFIESINQEVVILFDEFDKTFKNQDDCNPQDTMLSLFDGTTVGKKLFIVTCNRLNGLNDYLVNRPGRFHNHIRFDYPGADEIRVYLQDHLAPEYHGEIERVVAFASRISLNYDCLRSIAFELSTGVKFDEAIKDLNIVNVDDIKYKLTVVLKSGEKGTVTDTVDLFSNDKEVTNYFNVPKFSDSFRVSFNTDDVQYDANTGKTIVMGENLDVRNPYDPDDKYEKADYKRFEEDPILYMTFERKQGRNLHYAM